MSRKLHKLTDRMGDLTARRAELRLRIAGVCVKQPEGASVMAWANQVAKISESIGEIKVAIADEQGRITAEAFDAARCNIPQQVPA